MTIRKAYSGDLPNLMKALVKFAKQVEAQPEHYTFAKGFDLAVAYDNLKDAVTSFQVLYIGGYLVFFDVVKPWFSNKEILAEWFTIKVEDTATDVNTVPAALRLWAADEGYAGVVTADSSSTGIMAKAYEANGFVLKTRQYFKEV